MLERLREQKIVGNQEGVHLKSGRWAELWVESALLLYIFLSHLSPVTWQSNLSICSISMSFMEAKQSLIGDFWSKAKIASGNHLRKSYF